MTSEKIIGSVQFGVWLPEDVESVSSFELTRKGDATSLSLGSNRHGVRCETCGQYPGKCQGHSGHITLRHPVINVEFRKILLHIVSSTCFYCGRLLLPEDFVNYEEIVGLTSLKDRYKRLKSRQKDQFICESDTHKKLTTKTKMDTQDFQVMSGDMMDMENRQHETECKEFGPHVYCGGRQPEWILVDDLYLRPVFTLDDMDAFQYLSEARDVPKCSPFDIQRMLRFMGDREKRIFGLNFRPDGLMWHNLYVPPITIRVQQLTGKPDDLTKHLEDIIKHNGKLPAECRLNVAMYRWRDKVYGIHDEMVKEWSEAKSLSVETNPILRRKS